MDERFLKRWIFATTLGFNVGGFVGLVVFYTLLGSIGGSDLSRMFISSALASSFGGTFLGFAQWTVLRGYIVNIRRWILATTGSIIIFFCTLCPLYLIICLNLNIVGIPNPLLVCLALLGILTMGIAQGGVLGKSKIWQWLLATFMGFVGLAIIGCLFFALEWFVAEKLPFKHTWGTLGGEVLCGLILGGITGAATYGAITGKALIDILKN